MEWFADSCSDNLAEMKTFKPQMPYVKPQLSVQEPIRKQRGYYGPAPFDKKLRHSRVSFVKKGHNASEEESLSAEEAGTVMQGSFTNPPAAQKVLNDIGKGTDFQPPAPLSFPACSDHHQSEKGFTRPSKRNGHDKSSGDFQPQGTGHTSWDSSHSQRDDFPQQDGRSRFPSLLSNLSDEIIVFRGRKQAPAEALNATGSSASLVERKGRFRNFSERKLPTNLVDPLMTLDGWASSSSRSSSPDGVALGGFTSLGEHTTVVKEGDMFPDNFNLKNSKMNEHAQKFVNVANCIGDTHHSDDNGSSTDDQRSDLFKNNSCGREISMQKDPERIITSAENEKEHEIIDDGFSGHLRNAELLREPFLERQTKPLGLGFVNLQQETEDEEQDEEEDDALLSRMYIRRSRVVSKARAVRKSEESEGLAVAIPDEHDILDYGEFDIMDRQRPSIQARGKKKDRSLQWASTTSELEQSLQLMWDGDRAKKKARKQAREEFRQLGLLDRKGKVSLKAKYANGLSIGDVEDQIRVFLPSADASLAFPPIDHRGRKIIHEIANRLGLKSKSMGDGINRFPVLYKTRKSDKLDAAKLDGVMSLLGPGRHLSRRDQSKASGSKMSRKGFGGGFGNAAVSYHDGEIVGATAPELGQDNKGRAMLEKMGWSTGTALGALNNKGIMNPVTHVVKTTKAGLG